MHLNVKFNKKHWKEAVNHQIVEMEDRPRSSKLYTIGDSGVWEWGRKKLGFFKFFPGKNTKVGCHFLVQEKNNWIELVIQENFLEKFENLNIHFEWYHSGLGKTDMEQSILSQS